MQTGVTRRAASSTPQEPRMACLGESTLVTFPEGLVGFPDWRRFTLTADPDGGPAMLLDCLDDPSASFIVVDPALVHEGYRPRPSAGELVAIGLRDVSEARVLCLLTVRRQPLAVTANLLGPLLVNPRTGLARQVVLAESQYRIRHPVLGYPSEEPSQTAERG